MIGNDSYTVVGKDDKKFKTITFKDWDDNDIDFTFPLNRQPYMEVSGSVMIDDVLEAIELVKSGKVVIEL